MRLNAAADGRVELGQALGADPWASFYAATWLHASRPTAALPWFASDDGLRVWLNGKEILLGHHHDDSDDIFYRVPVDLVSGLGLLVTQVENLEYYVYLRARLTDREARPLPGVTAVASPRPGR